MTELFSRLFVKNYQNTADPAVRRAYGMAVSVTGILVNMLLSVGKLIVGILACSVAIQADAVNNVSDAGSSLVSLICFRISAKPADRDHPFGHARIEYVASMIVSFLILLIGFELFKSSATALYTSIFDKENAEPLVFSWIAVGVLAVSILGKIFLAALNAGIGKKIRSGVMRAAAADSLSDVLSTSAVLVATLVAHFVALPFSLDGAVGIAVSVLILIAGGKILKETMNSILGEAPDEETVETIKKIVFSFPEALGMHDLSVHQYGAGSIIASLHVEVDGAEDVFASHDAIDNIERKLWEEAHIRATVHLDPIVVGDPEIDLLKEKTVAFAKQIDAGITVHDFRFVRGTSHSNLIFDLAVPFECTLSPAEILSRITALLQTVDPNYYVIANIDRV